MAGDVPKHTHIFIYMYIYIMHISSSSNILKRLFDRYIQWLITVDLGVDVCWDSSSIAGGH